MAVLQNPYLTFKMTMRTFAVPDLIVGRLYLQREGKKQIEWRATSGLPYCQFYQSWVMRGRGPIPPSDAIVQAMYTVETNKYWYPLVQGIEGSSYKIHPERVLTSLTERSNFELHFDANQPGTAGCIAITNQADWDSLRATIFDIHSQGIRMIPLNVIYAIG